MLRIIPRGTFILSLLVLTVGALLYGFALAERRSYLYELRRRRVRTQQELRRLEIRRNRLLDERQRLLTEPEAIERVAREEYGMAAPGEVPIPRHTTPAAGPEEPPVSVPSDGWDWVLGRGEYPWRVPLLVFAVGAVVLGTVELIEHLCARKAHE